MIASLLSVLPFLLCSLSLSGGATSKATAPPSPGLVREEGEGLLEVELEFETGGEMTLGDFTGGEVGGGDPAGGWGLSWSSIC